MIDCSEARLQMSNVLAQSAERKDVARLEKHLAECERCRQVAVDMYQQDLHLIEVMSPPTLQRLSKRLHAGLERRRRIPWAAGALAASILIALGTYLATRNTPARPTAAPVVATLDTTGEVQVGGAQADGTAPAGLDISAGQNLRTVGAGSRAVLKYPDSTQVVLGADTRVQVMPADEANFARNGKKIFLQEGTLTADVAPQSAEQPMTLVTPHAEVVVLGTKFRLSTSAESTRIEVEEGTVQFRNKLTSRSLQLSAGAQASAAIPQRYQVSGTVSFKGKPVPVGRIYFTPDYVNGNDGPQGYAEIVQGRFDTRLGGQGSIAGRVIVRIEGYEGKSASAVGTALFAPWETAQEMPKQDSTRDFQTPASP